MGDEENASWDAQGCRIYEGTPSKGFKVRASGYIVLLQVAGMLGHPRVLKFAPVAILYFCKHVGHVELCRHVGPRR